MKHALRLTINGEDMELAVDPGVMLLDLLRDHVELTGCRRGCDSGYCGCCTVLLNGKTVHSCSILAVAAHGAQVLTIEGLARDGRLHPVQEAFIEHGAIQCGFCTPGMILSATALLAENPRPDEADVRAYLSGNLCRCTGYVRIVQAVLAAAATMRGEGA
ncbi:MAG: (2Fe-2S)-binding protein [Dehalococcoidia bacterium]|nr:(2Fe-2S)-binding protein [Dehalococcoidia bacterium]